MPVTELDVTNALFWLFGVNPSDPSGRDLATTLDLWTTRDAAHLREILLASDSFRQMIASHQRQPPPQALDLDRPRLVFLHIPKCGGTTLHTILTRQFAPESICPERFNALGSYRLGDLASYSLFSGHFDLESCRALAGRKNKIITMLREPRARLVSLYHFLSIHHPEMEPAIAGTVTLARTLPIEDFFQHPLIRRHASVYNSMASLLIEPQATVRWEAIDAQPTGHDLVAVDPEAAGQRAVAALKSLSGFGLLEQFDSSLELLTAQLGLRLDPIPPQQVTDELKLSPHLHRANRPAVTPELLAILDELTEVDRKLYAEAQTIFAERRSSLRNRAPAPPDDSFDRPQAIRLDLFSPHEARRDGLSIVASGTPGVLAAGPYIPLKHGRYRLFCHFAGPDEHGQPFTLNIWSNHGMAVCKMVTWSGPSPCVVDFDLGFDVSNIEFVILVGPDSRFELLAMELARTGQHAARRV